MTARVVTAFEKCPGCNGRGITYDELTPGVRVPEACEMCDGHGVVPVTADSISEAEAVNDTSRRTDIY